MRSDDRIGCDHAYAKLQEALMEAETLKTEVLAEHNRRKKTEQELSLALIRVFFSFYLNSNVFQSSLQLCINCHHSSSGLLTVLIFSLASFSD
jgi:hypothetical protein